MCWAISISVHTVCQSPHAGCPLWSSVRSCVDVNACNFFSRNQPAISVSLLTKCLPSLVKHNINFFPRTKTSNKNKTMSELLSVETRSRSRSKTPFLRSQCDHENCTITDDGEHVHTEKKRISTAPKVTRISEERENVQKKQTSVSVKPKTSDYSSEEDHSFEKRNNIQNTAVKVSSSTTTVVTRTSTHNKASSSSSTKNHLISSNEHLAETITSPIQPANMKQIRKIEAKIKTSTPIDHKKSSNRTMSADSSSSNDIEHSDSLHFAYQEYHDAGEYWK